MTLEIFINVVYLQIILSVIVVLMALVPFKHRGNESKLVGLTFLFGPIAFLSLGLLHLRGKDVNIPQSIDAILYFLALVLLYNVALGKRYQKIFLSIAILFTIFAVCNLLFIQQDDNNTYSRALRSLILIGFSIIYFYRLLVDLPAQHLHRMPMFWFNSAFLIYNAGTLFLFLFTHYLVEVLNNDMLIYWSFHNILNIVQHLIVMIGLWQDLRNIKSPLLQP